MDHEFVGIDWGTSSFRLWVMDRTGSVVAEQCGPHGMGSLRPQDYAPLLERTLSDLGLPATAPVVIAGMAGAAQGWCEAPYRDISEAGRDPASGAVRMDGPRPVWILPGLKQSSPANVMRGEETQISGFLALRPGHNGVLCLPGTHSKWVRLQDGAISNFQTAMTGEVFALIANKSVLRFSVSTEGTDMAAFDAGVRQALDEPRGIAMRLFSLRAEGLLGDLDPVSAGSRLSGMLIGTEIAAVAASLDDIPVGLIGATGLTALYRRALALTGHEGQCHDAGALTRAGLRAAFRALDRSCAA